MPCYTVQQSRIVLQHPNLNLDLIAEALTALGLTVTSKTATGIRFSNGRVDGVLDKSVGRITFTGTGTPLFTETDLLVQYGRAAVKAGAKKFGWKLTEQSETQFTATRAGW